MGFCVNLFYLTLRYEMYHPLKNSKKIFNFRMKNSSDDHPSKAGEEGVGD